MIKKLELTITKLTSSSFEGEAFASDLDLTLPGDPLLNLFGNYTVSFDDDIAFVTIEDCAVEYRGKLIDIPQDKYDYDAGCEWIEQNGPYEVWAADKQCSLEDYYYDNYRDGLYES